MATIFTKIVNGEIPSYKVAENDHFYSFLDINPNAIGHTLVIPKREENYIFHLEDQEYIELWKFAKKVAKALEQAVPCKRIGIAVVGLEVPHTHIHLIPLNSMDDFNFNTPKASLKKEEFETLSTKIFNIFNGF